MMSTVTETATTAPTAPIFSFGWIITRDYLNETDGDMFPSQVGKCRTAGRSEDSTGTERRALILSKGGRFRLKDDDGEVYYEGRMLDITGDAEGFEPLDWAMYDAGATTIEFWKSGKGGGWEAL